MKLATWNVNSIRARKERVLSWLAEHRPEIVCLQETKVPDDQFPAAELAELGYHAAFHGQKSYNGVAIVSRGEPPTEVVVGMGDQVEDDQARVIAATCRGLRVICVYVPNGQSVGSDKYAYKLEWMRRLRAYFDRACPSGQPVALCGDFNVAPDDRDVFDPARLAGQVLCTDAERSALANITAWGLIDAFRVHHADAGLYSWWDYRQLGFPKNRGLRIDMVYISQPLVARCTGALIDRQARKGQGASDHAPVVIELAEC